MRRLLSEKCQQHELQVGSAELAGAWDAVAHEAVAEAAATAMAGSPATPVMANGAQDVVEGEAVMVCIVKHILRYI